MWVGSRFRLRFDEQRRILTQHAERVAVRAGVLRAIGGRVRDRVRFEAPHENADGWDIVAADGAVRVDPPDIHRVCQRIERTVDQVQILHSSHDQPCGRDRDAGG